MENAIDLGFTGDLILSTIYIFSTLHCLSTVRSLRISPFVPISPVCLTRNWKQNPFFNLNYCHLICPRSYLTNEQSSSTAPPKKCCNSQTKTSTWTNIVRQLHFIHVNKFGIYPWTTANYYWQVILNFLLCKVNHFVVKLNVILRLVRVCVHPWPNSPQDRGHHPKNRLCRGNWSVWGLV